MKLVSITYSKKQEFDRPEAWLHRIRFYTGVLEALSKWYEVINIDRINYSGTVKQNGVEYYFADYHNNWLTVAMKLNREVRSRHPDVVLVQGMIFPLQVILLRLHLGRKVKIIVQNHAEKPAGRHRKFFQQLADPMIDVYLFTAMEMGEIWIKQLIIRRREKIREVMEASSVFQPVDKAGARTQLSIDGDPIFLWVGRLDANKDPITVVEAFLRWAAGKPSARLYMIFHTKELLSDVEAILDRTPGGRTSIVLIGGKLHEEMGIWYSAADYIVSGSHYEGSGVAVCEAMSCGCIPILTDILSFRKMTAGCGVLYEAGNVTALLSALEQAMEIDRESQREKVLQQFRLTLSFDAIAENIHQIVCSL
jgi:glycosyltransferase involved in cell wall biosynthesis